MNFARLIVGRGYASFTAARTLAKPTLATQARFLSTGMCQRYAAAKDVPSTTPLEAKIHQIESSVLSTPNRLTVNRSQATTSSTAHAPATSAVGTPAQLLKKRPLRKKRSGGGTALEELEELSAQGYFNVTAFATAEEYDLEGLLKALRAQNLYVTKKFFSTDNLGLEQDVLYVTAIYPVGNEARDIFFFREGSVVLWNFNEIEANNVLSFLRPFEKDSYLQPLVRGESEIMPYTYIPQSAVDVEGDLVAAADVDEARAFFHNGKFFLTCGEDNFLQKYTFSNAMATSIKLGIWESTLDRYIDNMEFLTEDLKKGRRIRISRADVLRKTGELFALRHVINLSSDLLDTPDFYWDREQLEALYLQVCSYFSISRRTKVMNEKLTHCVELAELVSHNLNDAHHIRLEWMIIILIMVEVGFEIVHYMDRYYEHEVVPTAVQEL